MFFPLHHGVSVLFYHFAKFHQLMVHSHNNLNMDVYKSGSVFRVNTGLVIMLEFQHRSKVILNMKDLIDAKHLKK